MARMIKLKFLFPVIYICLSYIGVGQNAVFLGSVEEDVAHSIYQFENNFYIAGTTRADRKSAQNYYVLRLHPNGSLKNEYVFGNVHYDTGFDILADETGIYVLGQTWDGGYGNNDMFLHKLDFSGEKKWSKFYGGNNNEIGHKFIRTQDGGFALAGHNRSLDDLGDAYLVKTNADGKMIWESHFGGRFVDHGFSVVENDWGEFVVAGTLGGFFVSNCCDFQNTDADIFIIKTNSKGESVWEKTFGGPEHDWAKDIILAPDGGYFVCGSSQGQGAGSFDMFLMKIDEDGNELWFKTYGGTDFDYGEAIGLNKENKLFILGTTASFSDNYTTDHLLVKTDLEGNEIWTKVFGTEKSDYSSGLVCTADSGCAITGTTKGGDLGNKDIVFYKISKDEKPLMVSTIPLANNGIDRISVFPNPVRDNFTVYIETKIYHEFQLNLYNSTGQQVYQKSIEPNRNSQHHLQLSPGIYMYKIQDKNSVVYQGKLVFTK